MLDTSGGHKEVSVAAAQEVAGDEFRAVGGAQFLLCLMGRHS